MIQCKVSAYGVDPCFERTLAFELRLFGEKYYKCIYSQFFCFMHITDYTEKVKNKSILIITDYFFDRFFISREKTAVTFSTVIHRFSLPILK